PFAAPNGLEELRRVMLGTFEPMPDAVPLSLQRVAEKALQNAPAARYQTMTELLGDLRSAASTGLNTDGVIEPPAPRTPYRLANPAAIAGLIAAITIAAVARWSSRVPPALPSHARSGAARPSLHAVDPAVREQVVNGMSLLVKKDRASSRKAIELFESAARADAAYAPAYAGLARAYSQLGSVFVAGETPTNVRLLAMRAARRAIEIDPDLAEAHAALGSVSLYELDWAQADASLRRAIELDPSN